MGKNTSFYIILRASPGRARGSMGPRLRDPASGRKGDFTQPRTNFFGHLCRCEVKILRSIAHTDTVLKKSDSD